MKPKPPPGSWTGTAAICPYCTGIAEFSSFCHKLYPYRRDYGPVWACSCEAKPYVGCHKGTSVPLGTLADATLRAARKQAHSAFDALWLNSKDRRGDRSWQYSALATHLGIKTRHCHIGWFDEAMCQRVTEYAIAKQFET